jgi:hypothetical protein
MSTLGRGRHPLGSSWFRSKTGFSRSYLLRTTPLFDPVVETVFGKFFYEPTTPAIQFVGAVSGISSDTAITLDLTTLTGGIASSPAENDIVIFVHTQRAGSDRDVGTTTVGYTEIVELHGDNGSNDTNTSVNWKRMGSTPDTQVVSEATAGRNIAMAYVLRGVDQTTPFDVTFTSSTGTLTGIANPPAITPTTTGAWVVAIAASMSRASTALTGPSGYSNSVHRANDGADRFPHLNIASKVWDSGSEDPGPVSGVSDDTTLSWTAATLALRPQQPAAGLSLVADAGSFTFTGVDANLERGLEVVADPGGYAFTGVAANLEHGREVFADAGSFAFTGTAANLELGREVLADPGIFAFTGVAANLERGREVVADPGIFAFTGVAANLERGREVVADPGSYAFTGSDATLSIAGGVGLSLVADPGSYAFTGVAAGLERGREVVADPGSFAFTGAAANLERGREVVADPGGYSFTGVAANLERGREVVADPGSFAFTGQPAALERGRLVAALFGTFTITGTAAMLERGREVTADPGSFAFTGQAAALERGREVATAPGAYAFTGQPAALERGREIAAQPGSFGFTGAAADLIYVPSFARTPYSQGFILS